MSERRADDEVNRLWKDADRDLARGLTVSDFRRKVGVARATYHRWRNGLGRQGRPPREHHQGKRGTSA